MRNMLLSLLVVVLGLVSCVKNNDENYGQMSFASNYNIVNCALKVSVYIDDIYVGDISQPSDSIVACGLQGNVTKSVSVGEHTYKIVLSGDSDEGCSGEMTGSVQVEENECEKIFINVADVL